MSLQENNTETFFDKPVIKQAFPSSKNTYLDKNEYLSFQNSQGVPSVRELYQVLQPVTGMMLCSALLKLFLKDENLRAIPMVDADGVPCALVERYAYIEYFTRLYSTEIFGKRLLNEIGDISSGINRQPIVVDAATSIDDVAVIILAAGMRHMVSGFIVSEEGKYLGVGNGHDLLNHITQRKQAELYYLAHYDQLTRIPNRMLLNDRLKMACRDSDRCNTQVGVVFIDLDRFKQINDTMGHSFGDILLQSVAERLECCIRSNDTVARLGGDEFAVLLQKLEQPSDAGVSAQRIVDSFSRPFRVLDRDVFITASLGVAIYPTDERDSSNLLTKADAAMYEVKTSGRNGFRLYEPGLTTNSIDKLSLEVDLRSAIGSDELVLHYQPQVNVISGAIVGIEALIRWQHPKRGLLSPAAFIGMAEENGMIIEIGNWVLREACIQQRAWSLCHTPPLCMAVNISAVQFRRENFTSTVREIIQDTEVDPNCIELELTENIAMHHAEHVLNTLLELKQIGVKLTIDDFGTGFSNLSYLQRFPFDRLKIDQSFVRGIESSPANMSIVQAIVSLAKNLSLVVVAEGVETMAEYAEISACACDEIQGYFHARPMPATAMLSWLLGADAELFKVRTPQAARDETRIVSK